MLHKAFGNSPGAFPIYALPRPKSRNQYLFIVFIVTVIEEFQHRRGEEREENEWQGRARETLPKSLPCLGI